MKLFKRFITMTVCVAIATLSLSGCSALFGSRCQHLGTEGGYDAQSHYRICSECGEKYDVKNHIMVMAFVNGNDTTQHFMKCVYCEYSHSYQPHDMTDWDNGIRRCTAEGCNYNERCSHVGMSAYVVTDDGHYLTCENCKKNLTVKAAHNYEIYTDITDATHSLSCECGKVSSEIVAHDFKYKRSDDSHWQVCKCGFETEKVACTFGNYESNINVHYKICSVCEGIGMMETHFHKLTGDRKRMCPECLHEEEPYTILLGTWKYSFSGATYKLTLNEDWSYSLFCYEGIISGNIIESGDYDVKYFEGLDGKISGTINLRAETGYSSTSIEYEFRKGVTNQFRDRDNRLHTKQ